MADVGKSSWEVVVYKPFPSGYMLRNVAEVIKYLGCSGLQELCAFGSLKSHYTPLHDVITYSGCQGPGKVLLVKYIHN